MFGFLSFSSSSSSWFCGFDRLCLGLEVLDFTNGAAEQHGENHSKEFDDTNANAGGKDVGKVLVEQRFQFRCAALV